MFSKFLMGGWVGEDRVIFLVTLNFFSKILFLIFFLEKQQIEITKSFSNLATNGAKRKAEQRTWLDEEEAKMLFCQKSFNSRFQVKLTFSNISNLWKGWILAFKSKMKNLGPFVSLATLKPRPGSLPLDTSLWSRVQQYDKVSLIMEMIIFYLSYHFLFFFSKKF